MVIEIVAGEKKMIVSYWNSLMLGHVLQDQLVFKSLRTENAS
jgi:hypothetical protein